MTANPLTRTVLISHPQRFALASCLIVLLAVLFWTGSRYPELDEKAMMSGAIQLEDPLGFEALFPLTEGMGVIERIFYSTINWINTNKKGMTFGVLFAAAFLTAAAYLRQKGFKRGLSNAVLGLFLGAPLGVCVNCAAPIAKGMYSAGLRAETTLAAMIASPTLNAIVLTMLFSILPFYMAVTKIALSLIMILLVVPWICGTLFGGTSKIPKPEISVPEPEFFPETAAKEAVPSAILEVSKSYLTNLWFIIKMTVPLMFLAGLLGATAATLLPGDMILGLQFGVVMLLIVSIVGVFLPVPIAFDVVVCGALLSLGLAPGYVMALLFTLGTFSIYSHFIVAQSISGRVAFWMSGSVVVLGVLAGLGVQFYHNWQSQRALDLLLSQLSVGAAYAQTAPTVSVEAIPFAARSPAADLPFTRFEAKEIGIDKPVEFSFKDMWPPFWEGRSLASGDIDRDGDIDLVIASTEVGLYVYFNDGTGQFTRSVQDLGPVANWQVFNAALVDIDNDGWKDLFVATYRQGNWILQGQGGKFDTENPQSIRNVENAPLSLALAFDDVDRNGTLDAALGNWAAGWYRRVPGEESRNRLILNHKDGDFGENFTDLPAIPGETLTILFSDIDQNGTADLLVGNDFEIPDALYLGDGNGGLDQVSFHDHLVPHTTTTTMAIKTADLMNDGKPEVYFAQIAGRASGVSETLKMQPLNGYCDAISDSDAKAICNKNMEIKSWYKSGNNFDPTYANRCQSLKAPDQAECKAMLVKDIAIQRRDPSLCGLIPKGQSEAQSFCDIHFWPPREITLAEKDASIPQILRSNVLLELDGDVYRDTAEARGLHVGGWSWDTKIADFDLDGFQDVYIVNGTWVPNEVSPSNLYFRNNGDGTFTEASGPFGLEDYLMTAAATKFDMDGDGDLDMVTHPVNGPTTVFRNNSQTGNAIAFQLRDLRGNVDGIGARVEITLSDGTKLMREVQMGGGFMSFDAPRVHFGLSDAISVEEAAIFWRTGPPTRLSDGLETGNLYVVTRNGS